MPGCALPILIARNVDQPPIAQVSQRPPHRTVRQRQASGDQVVIHIGAVDDALTPPPLGDDGIEHEITKRLGHYVYPRWPAAQPAQLQEPQCAPPCYLASSTTRSASTTA